MGISHLLLTPHRGESLAGCISRWRNSIHLTVAVDTSVCASLWGVEVHAFCVCALLAEHLCFKPSVHSNKQWLLLVVCAVEQ